MYLISSPLLLHLKIVSFSGTFFCIFVLSKRFEVQDSVIGGLASVSRIASCFVFAFAPTRHWYYAAPVFNIFSSSGLTAVRSIATKTVPNQEVGQCKCLFISNTNTAALASLAVVDATNVIILYGISYNAPG